MINIFNHLQAQLLVVDKDGSHLIARAVPCSSHKHSKREMRPSVQQPNTASRKAVFQTKARALSMVQVSTLVYGVFSLVGIILSLYVHKNFAANFALPVGNKELIRLSAASVLGTGVLIILSKHFEWWFPSYRAIKGAMVQVLGRSTFTQSIYLALISSVGEEILFRGAIQPFVGVAICSLLFGLLHIGPSGDLSSWSIWAVAAGWLLGFLYDQTGSLWTPIATHALVNGISILNLRRIYRSLPPTEHPEPLVPTPRDSLS